MHYFFFSILVLEFSYQQTGEFMYLVFSQHNAQTKLQKNFVKGRHFQGIFQTQTPVRSSAFRSSLPWGACVLRTWAAACLLKTQHKSLPLGTFNKYRQTDRRLQVRKAVALSCSQVSGRCRYSKLRVIRKETPETKFCKSTGIQSERNSMNSVFSTRGHHVGRLHNR